MTVGRPRLGGPFPTDLSQVCVALGSNLGDRAAMIGKALDRMQSAIDLEAVSGLYATPPMYLADQPAFLNAVAIGWTDWGPRELMRFLKQTEQELGRLERTPNGPREIDLDLVSYGCLRLTSHGDRALHLPHPRAAERRFVLEPLMEIAPNMELPGIGVVLHLANHASIQSQIAERVSDAPLLLRGD